MKLLEDRIRQDGKIRSGGVLKVDLSLIHIWLREWLISNRFLSLKLDHRPLKHS